MVRRAAPETLSEREQKDAAPRPICREEVVLGAAVFAPPAAWSMHLAVSYGLVYPALDWQSKGALHLVTALAAGVALIGLLLGARSLWRVEFGAWAEEPRRERRRFMALSACAFGLFFLLAIAAQSLPAFLLPLGEIL